MRKSIFYSIIIAITIMTSCQPKNGQAPDVLVSHIDTTVKPSHDFFMFANGNWFKKHPIPASEPYNGIFQMIQDTINDQIRKICESSASLSKTKKGSNKQKIGDFFYSGMDSISINKNGINDIRAEIEMIDKIHDMNGLVKATSRIHVIAGSPLFGFGVQQDDKNSSKNAIVIAQGGLSLPDRNYYFDTDSRAILVRKKFIEHIGHVFNILGYNNSKSAQAAINLMKLETSMAKTSRKREDTRDPLKNYNKVSLKQLTNITPHFNWPIFFENIGLHDVDTIIIGQPEFLKALNGYLVTYSLDDWKSYLKYHLVRSFAENMDDKTYLEFFSFYMTTIRGIKEPKPRWKRVVEETDGALGELIGQVYVDEYLPKGAKEKLLEIADNIKSVYNERIKTLDWMSPVTKEKAIKKLHSVIMKVGYPDKWKDLSSLQVTRSSYVRNVISANKWAFSYMVSKYGKPVDRSEWYMEPQTYNAYYNPSNNEIVVPGCNIIIPGYEHKLADDAILYSIIGGSTIGHEITHGFDDQGSKYDEHGNINNWWTRDDSIKFYAKTKMIVKQYNSYIAVDSLHINGELTQGENIADLGGVTMGYEAFRKTNQFKNHEIIGGLPPEKRFFLGYAMAWMINERPEIIANQVRSNEHSPSKFRVIGPLTDIPEFYKAFGIKKGDAMWREDSIRVKIW